MAFESTTFKSTRIDSQKAAEKLDALIRSGAASAQNAYQHAMNATITDALVRDSAVAFEESGKGALRMRMPNDLGQLVLTDYALGQTCERYGMPIKFARELVASQNPMLRMMAAENLETLARSQEKPGKALVRMQDGKVKAVLSSSFRRVDSRPMIENFVQTCEAQKLVPVEGMVTDTRIAIKALLPRVVVAGGDAIVFGMQLKNSDFGAGAFECKVFCMRLWCLNGALLETALRQVHLGRKLDEGTFSQHTYDLDSRTSISAMRDVIKGALSEGNVSRFTDIINASAKDGFDAAKAFDAMQKGGKITKAEKLEIIETYNSPDVEMLPAGNTAWRASNAVSWFAHAGKHSGDRKLELEKLAGDVITAA